jgi:N utilization substance protein B
MDRREARVEALEALYAADSLNHSELDLEGVRSRARRLAEGVWDHRSELDETIAAVATGWRIERMPPVDRNLLRLALYELRFTDTPVGVVVSEAVELAKLFSTANSSRFVNGVLGRLALDERPGETRPGEGAAEVIPGDVA